ncbi:hypothetical protein M9H77_29903 [Catharanthus roseus]|uniref:Uncharacterized protein n=1 Tax=Catharanthus roseus TaxID=4058 RepID=A0ACB9ZWM4_CATRO|nr:hypothetical protein M9H77_29903 [Catharanthus roseus]
MDVLKKARQMVEEPGSNYLHYLRKSHGLPCAYELVNQCQHLMTIQEEDVDIFWRKLEIGSDIPEEHYRDIESEMHDLTSLLQEISTAIVNSSPETAFTKGRRKTNSIKRDKSHWEYVSIAHRKIKKSSGSGSRSGSGSSSGSNPSPRGRGRSPRSDRSRGRERSSGRVYVNVVEDGNCGFRIVSNFLFGDENYWVEIRRRMSYDLRHHMHVYEKFFGSVECVKELIMQMNWEEGLAPPEYWMNTPDHLFVIANTFNLCVVFLARLESTTVLPLVSNMDGFRERYSSVL